MEKQKISKEQLEKIAEKYETIIGRIDDTISKATVFQNDLMERYEPKIGDIKEMIQVQSAYLQIEDFKSQKYENKVGLERQLEQLYREAKDGE